MSPPLTLPHHTVTRPFSLRPSHARVLLVWLLQLCGYVPPSIVQQMGQPESCHAPCAVCTVAASLTADESRYIEAMLLAAGASAVPAPGVDPDRLKTLHAVVAEVQSLGTSVSRLPSFPRRFTEAVLAGVRKPKCTQPRRELTTGSAY